MGNDLDSAGQEAGLYSGDSGEPQGTPGYGQGGLIPGLGVPYSAIGIDVPITSPSQVQNLASPPVGQPQAPGSSASVGVSSRAWNPATFDKAIKSSNPAIDRIDQRVNAEANATMKPMQDMWDKVSANGIAAQNQDTAAKMAKIDAMGRESQGQADIMTKWASEESRINSEYAAQANQAKSAYLTSLADLRASRVDPSQLFGSMSKGDQFGTLASVFVHDFLGAGPAHIKTSAMDTLNKAIDRNIDSQLEQIKIKGEVMQGFKNLWEMQRAQAASDAEGRLRVRGIMLDQMKQQVSANLAKYDSGLASAEGQQAIAAIDKEHAQNITKLFEQIDAHKIAMRGQDIHVLTTGMQMAMEQQKIDAASKAAQAGALQASKDALIPDVSPSGGGKARWAFTRDMSKGELAKKQVEILDRVGKIGTFDVRAKQLQNLIRQVDPNHTGIPTEHLEKMVLNSDQRRILDIANKLAMDMAYAASGKQLNETEIENNLKKYRINTWLTKGNTDKEIAQTIQGVHQDAFGDMAPYVKELGEGDFGYGAQIAPAFNPADTNVPNAAPGVGMGKEQDAILNGTPETLTDKAIQMIKSSPGQIKAAPGTQTNATSAKAAAPELVSELHKMGEDPEGEWNKYNKGRATRAASELDKNPYYDESHGAYHPDKEQDRARILKGADSAPLPDWAAGLEALRIAATKGDKIAIQTLSEYARSNAIADPEGMSPGQKISQDKREFAKYEMDQLLQLLGPDQLKAAGVELPELEPLSPQADAAYEDPPPKKKKKK